MLTGVFMPEATLFEALPSAAAVALRFGAMSADGGGKGVCQSERRRMKMKSWVRTMNQAAVVLYDGTKNNDS